MSRIAGISVLAAIVVSALAADATAATKGPSVKADGNGGVCSLGKHKSFRLAGSGWKPCSTVQLVVVYPDNSPKKGQIYSPLANNGQYKADGSGSFRSKNLWTCWPTPSLNYSDYTGTYLVLAYQLGAKPPVMATTYFQIVK